LPATEHDSRPPRLGHPAALQDMLLYRVNRLRAVGGGMVLRYCEGQFGVTRREWVMLALLSSGETIQPSELARRAELTPTATSKAVTAMVQKGLVERHQLPSNRRMAQLRLTDKGAQLYGQILPLVRDINHELMALLDAAEITALDSMLDRMQQQAEQMQRKLASLPRADRRGGGTRRLAQPRNT